MGKVFSQIKITEDFDIERVQASGNRAHVLTV